MSSTPPKHKDSNQQTANAKAYVGLEMRHDEVPLHPNGPNQNRSTPRSTYVLENCTTDWVPVNWKDS